MQYHSQGKAASLVQQNLSHGQAPPDEQALQASSSVVDSLNSTAQDDQKGNKNDAVQSSCAKLDGYNLFNNFAYKNIPNQNPEKPFGVGSNLIERHGRGFAKAPDQQASDKHLPRKNFTLKKISGQVEEGS